MSVRVRFEVPASGELSLTSARAALYGWLLARHERGDFFLHPATDPASPAFASVAAGLQRLGLDWDGVADERPAETTHIFGNESAPGERISSYVHLPPLLGSEAKIAVLAWLDQGYSGLALANCLARLGWTPRGRRKLMSLGELAARFDLRRMSRRPVRFDRDDLDWFNRRWLAGLSADQVTTLLAPHWRAAYGRADRAEGTTLSSGAWRQTLALAIREELDRPEQAVEASQFALADALELDAPSRVVLNQPYAAQVLDAFARELPSVDPYERDALDAFCRALRLRLKAALGIQSREVMYVLRGALAGRQDGPCLVEICLLLGLERCVQRAQAAARAVSDRDRIPRR